MTRTTELVIATAASTNQRNRCPTGATTTGPPTRHLRPEPRGLRRGQRPDITQTQPRQRVLRDVDPDIGIGADLAGR